MNLEELQFHVVCLTCKDQWGEKNGNGVVFFSAYPDNAQRAYRNHHKMNPLHTIKIYDTWSKKNNVQVQKV